MGQQQAVALLVHGQLQPVPAAGADACEGAGAAAWCPLLLDVFRRVAAGEVLVEEQDVQSPGGERPG